MWDTDKLLAETARLRDAIVMEHREKRWVAPRCILFRTMGAHSSTMRVEPKPQKAHKSIEQSKNEFAARVRQTIKRLRPEAALLISEMTLHPLGGGAKRNIVYMNLERPGLPRTIWIADILPMEAMGTESARPSLSAWTEHQPQSWFGGRLMDFFVDLETPN